MTPIFRNRMARSVAAKRAGVKRGVHIHTLGWLGERLSFIYYLLHGWRPASQKKRGFVQIDLLLQRGQILLLVEVKARRRPVPFEALLHPSQRQRLWQAARGLAAQHPHLTVQLELVQVTAAWPWVRRYALETSSRLP